MVCLLLLGLAGCPQEDEPNARPVLNRPVPSSPLALRPTATAVRPSSASSASAGVLKAALSASASASSTPPTPPPQALEVYRRPPPFSPSASEKQRTESHLRMQLVWRWPGRKNPAPTKTAEASAPAVAEALAVSLGSGGTLRCKVNAKRFPLLNGTQLFGWSNRLGLVLQWPSGNRHRVIPQGSLASLIEDQRVDVMPMASPKVLDLGRGTWRGQATQQIALQTSAIRLELDTIDAPEAGLGAIALCRMLAELGRIRPSNAFCNQAAGRLMVAARYQARKKGKNSGIHFLAQKIERGREGAKTVASTQFSGTFVTSGAPVVGHRSVQPSVPSTVPASAKKTQGMAAAGKQERRVRISNRSNLLMWFFVDDQPRLSLPPDSTYVLPVAGEKSKASWQTYLGTRVQKNISLSPTKPVVYRTFDQESQKADTSPL